MDSYLDYVIDYFSIGIFDKINKEFKQQHLNCHMNISARRKKNCELFLFLLHLGCRNEML
jgi:hypothetical protein